MLIKLKPDFKAAFENDGKVAINPNSALRLFAPDDPFLMERYELDARHWHVGITEEYVNDGEIRERLTKGLVSFFYSKEDAVKMITERGLDLEPSFMQRMSIRWQGRHAAVEFTPVR